MDIWLLDDSLRINIGFDCDDADLADNICISISESCPEDEKLFIADETNVYLTAAEAQQLAEALLQAVQISSARRGGQPEA